MLIVRIVSATIFVGITGTPLLHLYTCFYATERRSLTGVLLADATTTRAQLSDYANTVAYVPIAFRNLFGGIAIFLSFGFNIWATALAGIKVW